DSPRSSDPSVRPRSGARSSPGSAPSAGPTGATGSKTSFTSCSPAPELELAVRGPLEARLGAATIRKPRRVQVLIQPTARLECAAHQPKEVIRARRRVDRVPLRNGPRALRPGQSAREPAGEPARGPHLPLRGAVARR